jgi:hypothetical protein
MMLLAVPAAMAETLVLNIDQVVERAFNTDPRIHEKEKLVNAARGLLEEAQGAESWIFDVNTFLGLSPDVKGGIFEDPDGNIQIDADAFDFSGVSPWYSLTFEIVYPFSTLGKAESYAEAASNNIKIQSGEVQLQRRKLTAMRCVPTMVTSRRMMLPRCLKTPESGWYPPSRW